MKKKSLKEFANGSITFEEAERYNKHLQRLKSHIEPDKISQLKTQYFLC